MVVGRERGRGGWRRVKEVDGRKGGGRDVGSGGGGVRRGGGRGEGRRSVPGRTELLGDPWGAQHRKGFRLLVTKRRAWSKGERKRTMWAKEGKSAKIKGEIIFRVSCGL